MTSSTLPLPGGPARPRRALPTGTAQCGALLCVLLGAFSTSGTVAGLFALSSLAVHRHVRPALFVGALFVPSAVVCSIWLGRSSTWSVVLPTIALAAAAIACSTSASLAVGYSRTTSPVAGFVTAYKLIWDSSCRFLVGVAPILPLLRRRAG